MKKTLFLLFLSVIYVAVRCPVKASGGQAQSDSVGVDTRLPAHPRLLLPRGQETILLRAVRADSTWQAVHQTVLAESNRMLTLPVLERIQTGRRLLSVSRECLRRVFFLAYAYRLTGQKQYLTRAEQELLAVSAFSDWNPSHFLDVAEMTMGVAIGYDWLHDALPESSRVQIREAILKKGLEPSLDRRYNGWLNASHNWNQVCNAGMAFGALALYESEPQLARQLVNRAIRTVVKPMVDYAPDGAYPEGYNYWGYGTTMNVLLISALETALGTDFNLARQPGFLPTADYMLHMTGTTGIPFNYSDARAKAEIQPAMFWFARQRNDPSLLWVERGHLQNKQQLATERTLPAALIWGSGIKLNEISPPAATFWTGGGKNPVALFRSSWQDPKALYVGLKAGSPSVNHGHMDIGSFVVDAAGVRWAADLGLQEYHSLESKGVTLWNSAQDAQRWAVYRYNNRVHNTLTVDDQLQRVTGDARITDHSPQPAAAAAFQHAITDLSAVYAGQLKTARRGVALRDGRYVVVRDELETPSRAATVRWTMVTPAAVTITGPGTAELRKDGQTLSLHILEPAGATFQTWSTEPTHDYDAPNPGTVRVGFDVAMPANGSSSLTVLLLPAGVDKAAVKSVPPLRDWPK